LTVSEKVVACCSEPDVAVTLTVAVTGGGGVDDPLEEDPPEPPPHPLSGHRTATLNASSNSSWNRDRFLKKTQASASARNERGSNGLDLCCTAAAVVGAVIVTVVEIGEPDGVTVAGEKVHAVPEGSPEQTNETATSNPFSGVTDIETDPLCPAITVRAEGEAAREKSGAGGGGGMTTLKDAAAIALFE
jgi:hypothetical protein